MKKVKTWLLALFVVMSLCISCLQPLAVHAEETVNLTGGANNTAVFSVTNIAPDGVKTISEQTLTIKDGWEIVGYITQSYYGSNIYTESVSFVQVKNGEAYSIQKSNIADCSGYSAYYDKSGDLVSSGVYTIDNYQSGFQYKAVTYEGTINCQYSGFKLFSDSDSMKAYVSSGSLEGIISSPADIDSGVKDTDIGYLHGLKHKALQYGETDENGIPASFDDYFTWNNTYPEYDDSYLVEVRASCEVEVKKWFGIGKSTIYNSDIREIQQGIPYKDLEWTISLQDQKAIFNDFITEHMPGNDSVSDVISSGTYQFDTYYFRIYKWDEELETYRYGMWVRIDKNGTALDGSLDTTTDAGDFDNDGNWVQDPSSDYGDGKDDTTVVGGGEDKDSAKEDADQKQEEIENGNSGIDLSNANFMDIWEWFCKSLTALFSSLGVIPDFFSKLFSFLPAPIITFIGIGIVLAIILRFLGR